MNTNSVKYSRRTKFIHAKTTLTEAAGIGDGTIKVSNPNGLKVGSGGIASADGNAAAQEVIEISAINLETSVITLKSALTKPHALDSAVTFSSFTFTKQTQLSPEAEIKWEPKNCSIKNLRILFAMPNEVVRDEDRFEQELDTDLRQMAGEAIEDNILYGDDSDTELPGIMTSAEVPEVLWSEGELKDTKADAVARAIAQSHAMDREPNLLTVHPLDMWGIRLIKRDDGEYIKTIMIGADGNAYLWEVMIHKTTAMKQGDFLVGNFDFGVRGYEHEDEPQLDVSESHKDLFARDMSAVRVRERLGMALREPNAFVKGKFDGAPQ